MRNAGPGELISCTAAGTAGAPASTVAIATAAIATAASGWSADAEWNVAFTSGLLSHDRNFERAARCRAQPRCSGAARTSAGAIPFQAALGCQMVAIVADGS